ncbi:MAG: DUF1295 domain-containing protein [Kiritimatiellae bacterium]|nr:DUF1295 domain-containing protein [Kiritimatiellia bacterium]
MPLFSLSPLVLHLYKESSLTGWEIAGFAFGLVAILGEAIADRQLERFRSNPQNRGAVYRDGLWRVSRPPNYFFEWLYWWAYVIMGVGMPCGVVTLLGPVLMLLFLFKLTGIPYTEQQALSSRGDAYREYQKATPIFLPWFPQKTER